MCSNLVTSFLIPLELQDDFWQTCFQELHSFRKIHESLLLLRKSVTFNVIDRFHNTVDQRIRGAFCYFLDFFTLCYCFLGRIRGGYDGGGEGKNPGCVGRGFWLDVWFGGGARCRGWFHNRCRYLTISWPSSYRASNPHHQGTIVGIQNVISVITGNLLQTWVNSGIILHSSIEKNHLSAKNKTCVFWQFAFPLTGFAPWSLIRIGFLVYVFFVQQSCHLPIRWKY